MDKTLKDRDVKRMIDNTTGEEVLNLSHYCVARVDQLMSKIAKASNDYDTNTAGANGMVQNIKLDAFKKSIKYISDNCHDIIKATNGGPKLNPFISICPVVVRAPEPKRKRGQDAGGKNRGNNNNGNDAWTPQGNNDRGNGQGNNGRGNSRQGGSWDGG